MWRIRFAIPRPQLSIINYSFAIWQRSRKGDRPVRQNGESRELLLGAGKHCRSARVRAHGCVEDTETQLIGKKALVCA